MKRGLFIKKQLEKAGVDTSTEELKAILADETEIPDEAANKADSALMTVAAAVLHPDVSKVITQRNLSPLDDQMNAGIIEHGLTMNQDFVNEKSTYKKFPMYIKAIQEKLAKGKGDGNKEEWAKERLELLDKLKSADDLLKQKETDFASTRENDLNDYDLRTMLSRKEYALPKEMSDDLKIQTAKAVITSALPAGHSWKRIDGKLTLVNKEGFPALDTKNNVPYEASTFIDGALAQNKLLKINDGNQQQQQSSNGANSFSADSKANASVMEDIDAQLATFK